MYSPCLVRRDNIDRETYNSCGWYLNHLSVGRGLPCLDMHVRTRLSPSLKDIEGNPDIVGASGGPGNKKVSTVADRVSYISEKGKSYTFFLLVSLVSN